MFIKGIVEIEETDYSSSLRAAELTNEVTVENNRTLDPAVTIVDVDDPIYTFNLTVYQGSAIDTFLRTQTVNASLAVVFQRERGIGKTTASFDVAAMPPTSFGGEVGSTLTYQIALSVQGDITWGVSA